MTDQWTREDTIRQLASDSGKLTLAQTLAWRDVLQRHFNTGQRTAHLLDVGTGTGWLPILLANRRLVATGVDSSQSLLEIARQRAWEAQSNVTFVLGSAERLQFPNAAFDIVTAVNLLSVLENPRAAIRSWERVLKPGGRLLLVENDRDSADYSTFQRARGVSSADTPLASARADQLVNFLKQHGWQQCTASKIRGQLDRTGTHRLRSFAIGYNLIVAEKGGTIPL